MPIYWKLSARMQFLVRVVTGIVASGFVGRISVFLSMAPGLSEHPCPRRLYILQSQTSYCFEIVEGKERQAFVGVGRSMHRLVSTIGALKPVPGLKRSLTPFRASGLMGCEWLALCVAELQANWTGPLPAKDRECQILATSRLVQVYGAVNPSVPSFDPRLEEKGLAPLGALLPLPVVAGPGGVRSLGPQPRDERLGLGCRMILYHFTTINDIRRMLRMDFEDPFLSAGIPLPLWIVGLCVGGGILAILPGPDD